MHSHRFYRHSWLRRTKVPHLCPARLFYLHEQVGVFKKVQEWIVPFHFMVTFSPSKSQLQQVNVAPERCRWGHTWDCGMGWVGDIPEWVGGAWSIHSLIYLIFSSGTKCWGNAAPSPWHHHMCIVGLEERHGVGEGQHWRWEVQPPHMDTAEHRQQWAPSLLMLRNTELGNFRFNCEISPVPQYWGLGRKILEMQLKHWEKSGHRADAMDGMWQRVGCGEWTIPGVNVGQRPEVLSVRTNNRLPTW